MSSEIKNLETRLNFFQNEVDLIELEICKYVFAEAIQSISEGKSKKEDMINIIDANISNKNTRHYRMSFDILTNEHFLDIARTVVEVSDISKDDKANEIFNSFGKINFN